MNKTLKSLRFVLACLERRQKTAKEAFDTAVKEHRWSQVAGWDGIETGLLMAIHDVKEEIRAKGGKVK